MQTLKTNIQNLAMLSAVIAFASCETHKKTEIKENGTEVVTVRQPHQDTLDKAAEPPLEPIAVTGKVTEINFGKDGYTAKLQAEGNTIYFVTVSHSNLKDHAQYREAKIGETLSVVGDHWKNAEGQEQITVREMN